MPHYEAIIGTEYSSKDEVPIAVAEAVWQLFPVMDQGPPFDVDVYGGDGDQQIGVGVTFATTAEYGEVMSCGAEVAEEVSVE